jgi:hypothetical protein
MGAVPQVEKSGYSRGNFEQHVSPLAAVPSVRTAPGDEFLPAERDAACAAVPGFHINCYFIYELHDYFLENEGIQPEGGLRTSVEAWFEYSKLRSFGEIKKAPS